MPIRTTHTFKVLLCLLFLGLSPVVYSQIPRVPRSAPQFDIQDYRVEATLVPDAHEFEAIAAITFQPLEAADIVIFEISENLFIQKILDSEGVELEFRQDEGGPGLLSVRFSKSLAPGTSVTISIEYSGGFDRDRFSRMYTRDGSNAYIGMEGTYLLYSSKWFPVNNFMADRATAEIRVTVPLGITVIGPGRQLPVVTKGITETFGWSAKVPILPNSVVAGQYFQKKMQLSGFTLDCYARQDNIEAIQKSAEEAAKILAFYREKYGPSASGNSYRLVEVDDRLSMHPGMLGTIFITHRELAQSTPPIRQLARRIAYQWWQETVGVKSTDDLWLVDGMAYFSAAQYIGHSQGLAALNEEINNLAVLALKFESNSTVRAGLELGYRTDQYESVVSGKGSWILNMLQGILGDLKFNQLIQQYIQKYSGNGGSTSGIQEIAAKLYGEDIGWFFAEWIDTIGVPALQADYVIYKTHSGFRVVGTVNQDRDLFRMPIEVAIITREREVKDTIDLIGKSTPFDITTFAMPDNVVLDPENKLLRDSTELQTSVHLSMGNDLKEKGDFIGAIRAYESAIKLSPSKSLAYFRLAEVFFEQFNLQSAANTFREALNRDKEPKWIEVWCYIYLGKIYDVLGQRQRAMAEYNKAINTKDDTDGAQAEAKRWLDAPYTRERTTIRTE